MKKLLILFVLSIFAAPSFAQELNNAFYFRFGYSSPSWSQYGLEQDDWGDYASKYGANFEVGSIFIIQPWAAKNIALGINVDYLYLNYGNFKVEEYGFESNLGSIRAGSKIGPSFSFSPVKNMALDVYVKADIAWATAVIPYPEEIGDADDYYSDYGTLGLSTGLNFRYSVLMLGVEFNTISPKLESDDYPGFYLQEFINDALAPNSASKKSKMPCVNFTFGFCF